MSLARQARTGWRVLGPALRNHRRPLAGLAAWSVVESVPAFLSGRLVATAIDHGFLAGRAATGFGWLALLAITVVAGGYGARQTGLRLAVVVEPFRDELVRLVVTGTLRRSVRTGAGDAAGVARLTHQVEVVRESFAGLVMATQGFLISAVGALLGLFTLLPAALVLVLPLLLLGLAVFGASLAAMAARERAIITIEEQVAETVHTLTGGIRDVVACGAEERAATMAGRHIDAQADVSSELARVTAARAVAISLGGWVPLLLILLAAPWLTRGGATTGAVLGALTYISQGLQPALQALVRTVGGSALWLVVTLERIVEVADAPELAPPARPVTGQPTGFDLDLRAVTFRYSPAADPVVRDLDLRIPENDHIAVVGPSGIGKSTLAGLLAGTLEPQTGQILLGGAPLPPPGELAGRRVLLPQEAYVFAGTLWENLCYLRPDLTRPELDAAVDAVGLGELGARLGGYEATIEPEELSAGERQLVTLVRAYVATAPLTVLDEATCHLDPVAEARAEHAFARRPGTLVVIAHRISSALRARRILVLDGSHAMLGTHDELVVCSPLYRDLVGCWNSGWTAVAQCDS